MTNNQLKYALSGLKNKLSCNRITQKEYDIQEKLILDQFPTTSEFQDDKIQDKTRSRDNRKTER